MAAGILVNGQPQRAEEKPPKHVIIIRNPKWKEGDPLEKMNLNFPLPEDAGAEVRVQPNGYSIYFTKRETQKHPLAIRTDVRQWRVVHTEVFFNVVTSTEDGVEYTRLQEMITHCKFTEWEIEKLSQEDLQIVLDSKTGLLTGGVKPS